MSVLPTWAVYLVAFGTPIAAFVGVAVTNLLTRRTATELGTWRRREETMRMLRWACEHAVSTDVSQARMGTAALAALSSSELLQPEDESLIDAISIAVVQEPVEAYRQARGSTEVVQILSDDEPAGSEAD